MGWELSRFLRRTISPVSGSWECEFPARGHLVAERGLVALYSRKNGLTALQVGAFAFSLSSFAGPVGQLVFSSGGTYTGEVSHAIVGKYTIKNYQIFRQGFVLPSSIFPFSLDCKWCVRRVTPRVRWCGKMRRGTSVVGRKTAAKVLVCRLTKRGRNITENGNATKYKKLHLDFS